MIRMLLRRLKKILDEVVREDMLVPIKIDMEELETEVLEGALQTLDNPTLKAITTELNDFRNRYRYKKENIHQNLLSFGF